MSADTFAREPTSPRAPNVARRWLRSQDGSTSVEFAMVGLPFLMLMFGIILVGFYYFLVSTIENAAWQAGRAIRTGQMQQSSGAYAGATTDAQRKAAFKAAFCAAAPALPDCNTKTTLILQSSSSFAGIAAPNCAYAGSLASDTTAAFAPGGTSSVVLITVCYAWAMGGKIPFFTLSNLNDGSMLLEASVAFRSEPY